MSESVSGTIFALSLLCIEIFCFVLLASCLSLLGRHHLRAFKIIESGVGWSDGGATTTVAVILSNAWNLLIEIRGVTPHVEPQRVT